jgi:hypothetical protein
MKDMKLYEMTNGKSVSSSRHLRLFHGLVSEFFLLDLANLLHAPRMAATVKLCGKPGPDDFGKLFEGREARSER